MSKKLPASASSSATPVFIEQLEQREFLSASPVSHTTLHLAPGKTSLGKDFTLSITVKGSKGQAVTGSVEVSLDGRDVGGLTLTNGKASFTFGPGSFALYVGKHTFVGTYGGNGAGLPASTSRTVSETISAPKKLTTTASGLKFAVVNKGGGSAVSATGKTANILYSGFLTNGTSFDSSDQHPPVTPLPVTIGQHGVIPGFEEGVTGMKVGEERVLVIPPNLGYGSNPPSGIPADATLIFLVKLVSIS